MPLRPSRQRSVAFAVRISPSKAGFRKDTSALARTGQDFAAPQRIVETVIAVNDARKRAMVDKIRDAMDDRLAGKRVAVFGVTFKPNTDDMRDAPALTIVPALIGAGAEVRVSDPEGEAEGAALLPGVTWVEDPYSCVAEADALVVITEWNQFRALQWNRLKDVLASPLVIDLRNIYAPAMVAKEGFQYHSVGRPTVSSHED